MYAYYLLFQYLKYTPVCVCVWERERMLKRGQMIKGLRASQCGLSSGVLHLVRISDCKWKHYKYWVKKPKLLNDKTRSNQSILKELNPKYPLERLVLKLKPQYSGHLMQRANSLGKTLVLGKTEGKRRRRQQRMRWLDSITYSIDMNLSKLQEVVEDRGAWCPWGQQASNTS